MIALFELREPDATRRSPPQMFGNAGREHMERYGTTAEQFARIGEKNHRHSANNPYAQFQDVVLAGRDPRRSPTIYGPLTKLQCSPTSDGAAAAIVASERFVDEHGLQDRAVEIVAQAMTTDFAASFERAVDHQDGRPGPDEPRAARQVYEASGIGPEDVDVIELHDCFSTNELHHLRGARPVRRGRRAASSSTSGATTYGGDGRSSTPPAA